MARDKPSEWIHPVHGFVASRRHLPHIELVDSYYFTTSVTKFRRELSPPDRDIVLLAIRFMDTKKYALDAVVVMPDHFHMILRPLEKSSGGYYSLREIFHSIKSFTAHKIEGGVVWQDENFDHLIRNGEDYDEKLQYLIWNPVKSGLVNSPWDYTWLYWVGRVGPEEMGMVGPEAPTYAP